MGKRATKTIKCDKHQTQNLVYLIDDCLLFFSAVPIPELHFSSLHINAALGSLYTEHYYSQYQCSNNLFLSPFTPRLLPPSSPSSLSPPSLFHTHTHTHTHTLIYMQIGLQNPEFIAKYLGEFMLKQIFYSIFIIFSL